MNIIFDVGNVILSFHPKEFLGTLWDNEKDIDKVFEIVFASKEWQMLDKGTISKKDATERFCERAPGEHHLIQQVMDNWYDMIKPDMGTVALIQELKDQGHKLYILSNYHLESSQYIRKVHRFFDLFDGHVFSSEIQMLKPDKEIYDYLLNTYHLNAQECIFIDDMEENIKAAEAVGITGILFKSAAETRAVLQKLV